MVQTASGDVPGGVGSAGEGLRPATAYTQAWRPSETLRALRHLMTVAGDMPGEVARRADLTQTELRALEVLIEAPRGPVELSRDLGVTSAASSGIVDRLCHRGHVRRLPHPTDGRRTQVVISDSGREEVLSYLIPMFRQLQALDDDFSEEERRVVLRYLKAAAAVVQGQL